VHRPARGGAGDAALASTAARRLMATRSEILGALGLLPVWRRRAEFRSAPSKVGADESEAAPTPATTDEPPDDVLRRAHIAALTWPSFAADVDACVACG